MIDLGPVLVEAEPRRWGLQQNLTFFCGGCGTTYDWVKTGGRRWTIIYNCCDQCPPEADLWVPGSIWTHFPEVNAAFPDAVLREEFHRHLKWYDQQREKYDQRT
jgi:hypothetical protein